MLIVLSRAALVCLGYWRIKEKGQLAPREEAPVLAVPLHSSWIDFLATAVIDGRVIPISLHRKENEKIPFFGSASLCLLLSCKTFQQCLCVFLKQP